MSLRAEMRSRRDSSRASSSSTSETSESEGQMLVNDGGGLMRMEVLPSSVSQSSSSSCGPVCCFSYSSSGTSSSLTILTVYEDDVVGLWMRVVVRLELLAWMVVEVQCSEVESSSLRKLERTCHSISPDVTFFGTRKEKHHKRFEVAGC